MTVKQLLAFARKDMVQMQSLSLHDLLLESTKLLQLSATEKIQLNMNICEERLNIHGDSSQLHQVILNLVNNARDALGDIEQPEITISLQHFHANEAFINAHNNLTEDDFAIITVKDNGPDISTELMDHIFEPFFTTKDVGKGTGLGLAMVDGAIKTHRGVIEVTSSPGTGTAFHIYLPLIDIAVEKTSPSIHESLIAQGEGELILIIDDEESIREITHELIEAFSYQSITAANGMQAVTVFKQHQHDIKLVITDLIMPVMGGVKAAVEIRKIVPHIPVFATGYDHSQVLSDTSIDDPFQTLTKPYSVTQLSQTIKALTE